MNNQIVQSNIPNISATIGLGSIFPKNSPPHFVCASHFHDDLEFLYIISGKFLCVSNDVRYIGDPGDIFFINSRIPHETYTLDYGTRYNMLQFDTSNFSSDHTIEISKYLSRFINISKDPLVIFKAGNSDTTELTGYLEALFSEFEHKKPSYELYIKANILNIIAFLSRNNILTDSSIFFNEKEIEKVMPALNYIDTHYNEQITLEDLSRVLSLNPSYFCRLFKKATNSTFIEYLNFVRICKSEKKLSSSKESISDISLNLGFSSVSYFNKVFKKFKGCTPTEYKKSKYALQ